MSHQNSTKKIKYISKRHNYSNRTRRQTRLMSPQNSTKKIKYISKRHNYSNRTRRQTRHPEYGGARDVVSETLALTEALDVAMESKSVVTPKPVVTPTTLFSNDNFKTIITDNTPLHKTTLRDKMIQKIKDKMIQKITPPQPISQFKSDQLNMLAEIVNNNINLWKELFAFISFETLPDSTDDTMPDSTDVLTDVQTNVTMTNQHVPLSTKSSARDHFLEMKRALKMRPIDGIGAGKAYLKLCMKPAQSTLEMMKTGSFKL